MNSQSIPIKNKGNKLAILLKYAVNKTYICRISKEIIMARYIYQHKNWPNFTWDEQQVQTTLGKVRHLQGRLFGQLSALGFSEKEETQFTSVSLEVLKSSEIEGEKLNEEQVRSSIARKLGINYAGMVPSSRDVEGVVEMMLDATQNYASPLDEERLFGWHAALFPSGRSGMHKIDTACYRSGEMQIVSGPMGKERVHFEAPPPEKIKAEMDAFLSWYNSDTNLDLVVKAAVAHFWFIIIHPFDDGNGRIARALSDLLLTRSEDSNQRFYSLSSQILIERKVYYATLQKVQHSTGDISKWMDWFLNCFHRALLATEKSMKNILRKSEFWDLHKETILNGRQRLIINKLFDGFEGKLKTSKWAKITKCSTDTALRDIKDLMAKEILKPEGSGGRSTNYELVEF